MRQVRGLTGAIVVLALALLAGCGGGAKKESPVLREFVRVNVHDDADAAATNASGTVALTVRASVPGIQHYPSVVVWKDGALTDIGKAFDDVSMVADINDSGQVLLHTFNQETGAKRAFVYAEGVATEIRGPGSNVREVVPVSLSNDGTVLGYFYPRTGPPHSSIWDFPQAFLWRNGDATVVDSRFARSLNNRGQYLVFLAEQPWTEGGTPDSEWALGQPNGAAVRLSEIAPGARQFDPMAINDNGIIVGSIAREATAPLRPGVIQNGKMQTILPDAQFGTATGVTNRGDIIGTTQLGPFLVRSTGTILNLSDLFPDVRNKSNIRLVAINDDGQIIGIVNEIGSKRVFVLKPRQSPR